MLTLAEASAIGEIISTADSGCSHCVEDLRAKLAERFPQFTWRDGPIAAYPHICHGFGIVVEEKA